ncbi:hypothetical protein K1T71_008913, partial [Dendrolimus kikuchii]
AISLSTRQTNKALINCLELAPRPPDEMLDTAFAFLAFAFRSIIKQIIFICYDKTKALLARVLVFKVHRMFQNSKIINRQRSTRRAPRIPALCFLHPVPTSDC